MDPLTLLGLAAIGYAIFHESAEERQRREQQEAERRAKEQAERAERERWEREQLRQEQIRRQEAQRREEERRRSAFSTTRECFSKEYVSFTRMRTYITCPQKFKLLYLDHWPEKDDLLQFGKGRLVHKMIESYLRLSPGALN